jgi:hypothetical protein
MVFMSRPGLLPPEAVELIAGQYADRPHLRPVLDAVLAAVPSLGAVTVEARKTLVSLVTPRRTFAIVQATTKNRVDLGLRLEGSGTPAASPRLQPARNLGPATVRIGLTNPAEFDDEALGWLRLAYEQNTAPRPPRRKPAPRPTPEPTPLTVVIEGTVLPERSPGAAQHQPGPAEPGHARTPMAGDGARARRRSRRPVGGSGHGQAWW